MSVSGGLPVEPAASASPRPSRRRRLIGGAAVVLALVLTAVVAFRWGATAPPAAAPNPSPSPSVAEKLSTAEVYAALAPSVVVIEALDPAGKAVESVGTGVIANNEGVILTALHVVKDAGALRVTFADGTVSAAKLQASDPTMDIAALTPATLPNVLVPATLGNSGRLAVGDDVVAIGNQLSLASSATAGVVSGLDRSAAGRDGVNLTGLIQFDAAVNPGSSGGPLVNAAGETIGIVVALANPTDAGTFIGIGFAVPIGAAVAAGGGGPGPQQ